MYNLKYGRNIAALLAMALLVTGIRACAQKTPFRFGIDAGANYSYLSFGGPRPATSRNYKIGPSLSGTATYTISKHFFLQSGLGIVSKGTDRRGKAPMGFASAILPGKEVQLTSQQWYAELPVYAGYKITLSSRAKLLITAGPYLGYGFAGKTKLTGDILFGDMIDNTTYETQTFGDPGLKRLDVGLGSGIGIDLGETIIGLHYEYGLRNIRSEKESYIPFYNSSYKNRSLQVSVDFKL
jgi:hypothetical protein